jgi:nucleoside-diphosphate-sugar epimerase
MTTVAVTGIGGLIGRALLPRLQRMPVDRVVGLDIALPRRLGPQDLGITADGPRVDLVASDVRDPELAERLVDVDVLVHLAFQMDPIRDLDRMRSINVDGTRNVLDAARTAGVRRVIVLSSVVAYGAHADGDVPLTEDSPLRGQPGFPYAEHKREVEEALWAWRATGGGPAVTVLRSAAVLGPGVENFLTRLLELPRIPVLPDAPPLQFVHLDDIVGAILHALTHELDGAFNVASDGWLEHDRVVDLVGRGRIVLDADGLRRLVARAHRLGVGELGPAIVDLFVNPWVMSNERLRSTGWAPTRTNEEALLEAVLEHADHVALGRLRVRRRTVRNAVALAAGAVVAAVAATRLRR